MDANQGTGSKASPKSLWRSVAVPSEHGGWSLTAEPVALGLIIAWSWSGLALGAAAIVAFIARTPLKLVLVDLWRRRWLPRSRLAVRILLAELAIIALLGWAASAGSISRWFWVPLAIAVPLVAIELWFDMRSRGRRLVPELAGTIGIGSVVAAILLIQDQPTLLAVGVWVVVSARAIAAIPYARLQVARAHGRTVSLWHSDVPQLLAVVAVAFAWLSSMIPLAPVVAIVAVAGLNLSSVRGPVRRAVVIGIQQTIVGVVVVGVTAVAVLA